MKAKYITIEREYGSGGTKIARMLAERTDIPCYGQEILEEVSRKYDISVDRIQSYEESATNSVLYSIYMMTRAAAGSSDMLSAEGHIYVAEQEIIRHLAANGSSIFLGHCASEALKDQKGVVKVFIRYSDENEKRDRIVQEYGIDADRADVVRRKFDKKRSNYYYVNTMKKWEDLRNYDVVLDSAVLGIDKCADMLESLMK